MASALDGRTKCICRLNIIPWAQIHFVLTTTSTICLLTSYVYVIHSFGYTDPSIHSKNGKSTMSPRTQFSKVWSVLWPAKLGKCHIFMSQILFLEIHGAQGYTIKGSKGSGSKEIHWRGLTQCFSRAILYITFTKLYSVSLELLGTSSGNAALRAKLFSLSTQFTSFPSRQSLPGHTSFRLLMVLHEETTFCFPRIFLTFLVS